MSGVNEASVDNIGRKVPYCSECETATFTQEEIITDENGKEIRVCEYCGDKLGMRCEDRIKEHREGKVLGDFHSHPSTVIRTFDSPWGRVKMCVSTHSFFAPFIELEGIPSPALKRLVDEEFHIESIMKSYDEFGGVRDILEFSTFVSWLQGVIMSIHLDPNSPGIVELNGITRLVAA